MRLFAYLLALFLGTAVFAFWAEQADARAFVEATKVGQNVNGFGWSSNYGWVSFNSDACDANGDGACSGSYSSFKCASKTLVRQSTSTCNNVKKSNQIKEEVMPTVSL